MAWIYLVIAGLFEIVWAVQLKETHGFTKLYPSILTCGAMIISLYFLGLATKVLPIGIAYVVWTGIGALGTVVYGILILKEPSNIIQCVLLINIFFSIIGLKLSA